MKLHRFSPTMLVFHCPGCECGHFFQTGHPTGPNWDWNGDMDKVTIHPSLRVNGGDPASCCHSFITNGKIQFLNDSFHKLKGQTVEIPDWE